MEKCIACKFWLEHSDSESIGYCRRFPPMIISQQYNPEEGDLQYIFSSPIVGHYDWCGEFKPFNAS